MRQRAVPIKDEALKNVHAMFVAGPQRGTSALDGPIEAEDSYIGKANKDVVAPGGVQLERMGR